MFEVGKSYRVRFRTNDSTVSRVGEFLARDDDILVLNVEGVKTFFHLGSGSILYLEEVDEAAEAARDKARADRNIAAWS